MDLLHDPIIRFEKADGSPGRASLPGLLAALALDEVASVTAIQAHQRHAFNATLVQLAAIGMHAADVTELPTTEAEWRDLLLGATPAEHRDTAWLLVGPYDRPAFLQPAIVGDALAKGKPEFAPTDIEVLVNSRSHDLKIGAGRGAEPDEWLAYLVSLQAQAGFSGPGNVGIARMNSGFGSRTCCGLVPPGGPGARFARDVRAHLALRSDVVDGYPFRAEGGIRFLWLVPWADDVQLAIDVLDPYFVEVARRVRLCVAADGTVACHTWNNKSPRVHAVAQRGNLGDLWTAVVDDAQGPKGFTGDETGLPYDRMASLMLGSVGRNTTTRPSPLTRAMPGDPATGMRFQARYLARGQGKTEGYHERTVPVSSKVSALLGGARAEPYGLLSREMITLAKDVANRVLSIALMKLANGGEAEVDFNDKGSVKLKDSWIEGYHARVDARFFECLADYSDRLEADGMPRLLRQWQIELFEAAKATHEDAVSLATGPAVKRGRAQARSRSALMGIFSAHYQDAWTEMFPPRDVADQGASEEGFTEAGAVDEEAIMEGEHA